MSAAAVHAQVRELWQNGVTNIPFSSTNYSLTVAVPDVDGNTIVGGDVRRHLEGFGITTRGFLTKFGANGGRLWEYEIGGEPDQSFGVQTLAVDAKGNSFFTAQLDWNSEPYPLTLVKISASGQELWRSAEDFYPASEFPSAALAVDKNNDVFLSRQRYHNGVVGWVVAKFDSATGRKRWETALPGSGYLGIALPGGMSKSLALTEDNGIVVAGLRGGSGFIAKLDSGGRIEWWTDDYKGKNAPDAFRSVLVSPRGTICASDFDAFTVFSERGKRLHTGSIAGEAAALTAEGGFVLNHRGYLQAISSTGGNVRWIARTELQRVIGIAPMADGGFLAAGDNLTLVRLGKSGNELWRTDFQTLNRGGFILGVNDGTFRIVTQLSDTAGSSPGIAVIALDVQ